MTIKRTLNKSLASVLSAEADGFPPEQIKGAAKLYEAPRSEPGTKPVRLALSRKPALLKGVCKRTVSLVWQSGDLRSPAPVLSVDEWTFGYRTFKSLEEWIFVNLSAELTALAFDAVAEADGYSPDNLPSPWKKLTGVNAEQRRIFVERLELILRKQLRHNTQVLSAADRATLRDPGKVKVYADANDVVTPKFERAF